MEEYAAIQNNEPEYECKYQGKCVKKRCLIHPCDEKVLKIIPPLQSNIFVKAITDIEECFSVAPVDFLGTGSDSKSADKECDEWQAKYTNALSIIKQSINNTVTPVNKQEQETVKQKYDRLSNEVNNGRPYAEALGFNNSYDYPLHNVRHILNATCINNTIQWLFDNGFDIFKSKAPIKQEQGNEIQDIIYAVNKFQNNTKQ